MDWGWEVIGFHRDTKNLIDLSGETPDPDVFTFINLPDKVTAEGIELVGHARLGENFGLQGSYTHSRTRQSGSSQQLDRVPEDIAQATLDWHPQGRPFGGSLVVNHVGSVTDQVSGGFGPVQHGNYTVLDVNAFVTFGPGDHHKLIASIQNVADEDYFTRLSRATRDTGGSYIVHSRGVPRTLHVTYSYSF